MKILRNWFCKPRPLPIDAVGRVDLMKQEDFPTSGRVAPAVYLYHYKGWPAQAVELLNGDVLICLIYLTGNEPPLNLHDDNHNIFRLDKDGHVVWQVQRDELWRPSLEETDRRAVLEGGESERDPFGGLVLIYADGTNNGNPQTGNPPNEAQWVLGCTVRMHTFNGKFYELDIEAGIARNITPRGQRLW